MQPHPDRGRAVSRLLVLPAALITIVLLAYLATRPLGNGGPQASFFVIGSAVPGIQLGQVAPGTAEAGSPELSLTDLDGATVDLADFEGRPIWVIFWKTACEPCEEEAPEVAAAYAAHQADGLVVIGIDIWESAAVVQDYAEGHPIAYPIAIATTPAAMDAYGVWGAPTHYFIDRSGIIRGRHFGPVTRDLINENLGRII